jgi:hypothetical protein
MLDTALYAGVGLIERLYQVVKGAIGAFHSDTQGRHLREILMDDMESEQLVTRADPGNSRSEAFRAKPLLSAKKALSPRVRCTPAN